MSYPHRRIALNDSRGYIPQRPATFGGMAPPPLPPRRRSTVGPAGTLYGSPFGGGYMSPYGGGDVFGSSYSQYPYRSTYPSRYGGYGGYGGYGAEDPYSPFQSVESIVRAISSLSMMVESTYQSMYMSFRAVLGVAENMDQLRRVVFDLFGSLTLVRTVVWFCKKIMYILGLLKNNPVREKAWEAAAAEVSGGAAGGSSGRTWPLVAFFGLMLGGPYVLYKLASPTANATWDPKTEGGIKCVAIHDFETDQRGELPFRRGDVLVRQNQVQGGWALATKKGGQVGLVPADRLKPISQLAGGQQRPLPPKANGPAYGHLPVGSYGPYGPINVPNAFDVEYSEDELLRYQPTAVNHPPAFPQHQHQQQQQQLQQQQQQLQQQQQSSPGISVPNLPQVIRSAVTPQPAADSAVPESSAPANSSIETPQTTEKKD